MHLSVKLQAAFGLVMFVFMVALSGVTVLAPVLGLAIAALFSRAVARSVAGTSRAIRGIVSEDIGALTRPLSRSLTAISPPGSVESRPIEDSRQTMRSANWSTYNALAATLNEIAAMYGSATDSLCDLIAALP